MSTSAHRGELEGLVAFLCHPNQGDRLVDSREHLLGDRRAFVEDQGRELSPPFEGIGDCGRTTPEHLFIVTEGQHYGARWGHT